MIKSILFALTTNIFFMSFFFMFSTRIFHLKYTKRFAYICCLLIGLPYAVIASLGTYTTFYQFDPFILMIIAILGMFVLVISRQIMLVVFTDANMKQAFIYQLIYYFVTLSYYGIEDFYLYIIQNHYLLVQYELFLWFLFKIIAFYLCGYFTVIICQNTSVVFMNKKEIFLFVLCFFTFEISLPDSQYDVLMFLVTCFNIFLFYLLIRRVSLNFEIEQVKALEQIQMHHIQSEYQKQSLYLEKLAKIRHDEKNHMFTFQSLYQKDQTKALHYLKEWHQQIETQMKTIRKEVEK